MTTPRVQRKARTIPVHQRMRHRGNACLIAAGILAVFLVMFMFGAGSTWTPWQTWMSLTVATAAGAALACCIAATVRAPRPMGLARMAPAPHTGDSPIGDSPVSHLQPVAPLTPLGQDK